MARGVCRPHPNTGSWSAPVRLDDDGGSAAQQSPTVALGAAEVQLAWRDNRLSASGDIQSRTIQTLSGLTDHFALSYDGPSRLTAVSGPVAEGFTLDGPSNITSRSGPSQTDSYDQSNRLTRDGALSYTWSDADRLTGRGADTFGYDPLDRMTSSTVSGGSRALRVQRRRSAAEPHRPRCGDLPPHRVWPGTALRGEGRRRDTARSRKKSSPRSGPC